MTCDHDRSSWFLASRSLFLIILGSMPAMSVPIESRLDAEIDIRAYFDRIAYDGPRTVTLDTLRALHLRHSEAIPFENLDPFLGHPVHLDLASLERKLIQDRRGGYCYEHNLLFGQALRTLGFRARNLSARVVWNRSPDALAPRSHMLLAVDIDDTPYVADVGFGGQTLTGPLRIEPRAEQTTPHEAFRLMPIGDELLLEARIRAEWKPLYRFDLAEQHLADYEVSSWYLSNHPTSHFVTGLIASRAAPGRRYALHNNELAVHDLATGTTRRSLGTVEEFREALERDFRITLPDGPELDVALGRLVQD